MAKASKKEGTSFEDIILKIKKREFAPIYALHGEENFFIDKISDALENGVLNTAEKDFNLSVFYGRDSNWAEIVSACRRYPMFAEKQLVILKEAQDLKDIAKLEVYVQNPLESTVFVICHKNKSLDKRTKFVKTIETYGVAFESKALREYDVPKWVVNYGKDNNLNIPMQVAELINGSLGNDLQKITNEIEKVLINHPDAKELTPELVEKYIGISREYNAFELANTLMKNDRKKAYKIMKYFVSNPKDAPLVVVNAALYGSFSKLYAFHHCKNQGDQVASQLLGISTFVVKEYHNYAMHYTLYDTEQALHLILEYSMKNVGFGSSADSTSLLQEMIGRFIYKSW